MKAVYTIYDPEIFGLESWRVGMIESSNNFASSNSFKNFNVAIIKLMKLITQNLLMCNKKGCTTNNFPLKLVCTKVELYQDAALMEYSKPLMQRLLQKLDLGAL